MTEMAIKKIIDKYELKRFGSDKIGTKKRGINPQQFAAEVGPAKAEILRYWDEEEKARRDLREAEERNFESIEGLKALREARQAYYQVKSSNYRAWERGDGVYIDCRAEREAVEKLEATYPIAVWALDVEHHAECGGMTDQARINRMAYEALRAGEDPAKVKTQWEQHTQSNVARHIWD